MYGMATIIAGKWMDTLSMHLHGTEKWVLIYCWSPALCIPNVVKVETCNQGYIGEVEYSFVVVS